MIDHKHIPWGKAKQELLKSFKAWIDECPHTRRDTTKDMIEFLYQMGFIGGKKWRTYIDSVSMPSGFVQWIPHEPLEEGKIPPDALI